MYFACVLCSLGVADGLRYQDELTEGSRDDWLPSAAQTLVGSYISTYLSSLLTVN